MKARTKKAPAKPAAPDLPPNAPVVLDRHQLCRVLGVSVRTFNSELAAGRIPPPDFKVGARDRWNGETIDRWRKAPAPGA